MTWIEHELQSVCQGWAENRAASRYFGNPKFQPQRLRQPHQQATRHRMGQQPVVLLVQDTELDYSAHPPRGGGTASA